MVGVCAVSAVAAPQQAAATQRDANEVVPGVRLSSDALVWVLDNDGQKKQALPLAHRDAAVANSVGSNMARSAVLMKQKKNVSIPGAKATTRLHSGLTSFFVQETEAEEKEAGRSGTKLNYAIVKLEPAGDQRMVGHFEFSRFKAKPLFQQTTIETTKTRVPDSQWVQVTPVKPLEPGEYGLVQLFDRPDVFSPWVFDFAVDPAGK